MRARDLGIDVGPFPTGPSNAITDVSGVRVGHATVIEVGVRTGVTAIVPPGDDLLRSPVRAATFVANGHTKSVGLHQVAELGALETPILLTGTLSVFAVADSLLRWVLGQPGNETVRTVNPVVGETNDSRWGAPPSPRVGTVEVEAALRAATDGPPEEGCVGAGTGTVAFGFKAGVGTSSRVVDVDGRTATVGVLVQSNHGGRLVVSGRAVGASTAPDRGGSVVVVAAIDAPLDARQLARLARRAAYALARTGGSYGGRSGDLALAFSTEPVASTAGVGDGALEELWLAVQDAVDESVLNSLLAATDATTSDGSTIAALRPADLVD